MKTGRRAFLHALAAGAFAAIPLAGIGAPARVRRLGVMWDGPGAKEALPRLFRELAQLGFVENRDFVVQLCAVDERNASAPGCAATLAHAQCDVIFTTSTRNTRALQQATRVVPIVTSVADPVGAGFAANLARPGGNITGLANSDENATRKMLETARHLIPGLSACVVIAGAREEYTHEFVRLMQLAVRQAGISCRAVFLDSMGDAQRELRTMRGRGEQVAIAFPIEFGDGTQEAIARLAVSNRIALISSEPEWARAGGLFSHSLEHRHEFRRQASRIAMIFRGANPASIPFELPDTTVLVVNRTTAAKLGIRIPAEMLIAATEVVGRGARE